MAATDSATPARLRFHSGADSHLHNPLLLTCHTEPIALLGTNNRRRVTIRVAVVVAVATIARADRTLIIATTAGGAQSNIFSHSKCFHIMQSIISVHPA